MTTNDAGSAPLHAQVRPCLPALPRCARVVEYNVAKGYSFDAYTAEQMLDYAVAAVAAERERLRAALELAAPALELGCDALRAEAERYHAEMAGYRPHRHQELDDDYKRADLAWQAVVAALGPNVRGNADPTAPRTPE